MRRAMVLLCLICGGCATSGGVQSVTDQIKLVQEYTRLACSFVPAAATITAVFNQNAGQTIDQAGSAICQAVTSIPLSQGGTRKAFVGNVQVKGTFTNGRKI